MFSALSRRPRIFCSPYKEPRFFAFAGERPSFTCPGGKFNAETIVTEEADYFRLFSQCLPGAKAGEASTLYLTSPNAPETAARYIPDARLIAILRHPVERGYLAQRSLTDERACDRSSFYGSLNFRQPFSLRYIRKTSLQALAECVEAALHAANAFKQPGINQCSH